MIATPGSGFTLMLTGLGARYNINNHFSAFGELGFLNQGIVNVGVAYKL